MPILQKRKVHFTKDSKSYGKKVKKTRQVQKYTSSSESQSENEIAKNETGRKGKNIVKILELSKTLKFSSSESKSTDKMPKTKTGPEKQQLTKNGSPKKYLDFSRSLTKNKTLSADEGSKNLRESSSENLELTRSDSDEPPLVIDEDSDDDLLGLKKYMRDELKLNALSPAKAKLIHDAPQSMPDKNSNNVGSSSESESDIEGTQETKNANNRRQIKTNMNKKLNNASSESVSDSQKVKKRNSEKDAHLKENLNKNSNNVDSESDSDIEGTQEILSKKPYRKVADSPKKYTNENVNTVISQSESESDVEATQKLVKRNNDNKGMKAKNNTNKMSNIQLEYESEPDVKAIQKLVKTKNDNKDVNIKSNTSHITSESESESDVEKAQKSVQMKNDNKDVKSKCNTSNITSESESEPNVEKTQKPVQTKNNNNDVITKSNRNKMLNVTYESESDSGEKSEKQIRTNFKKVGLKIKQVINQVSKVVSSESESDEETQEIKSESKCIQSEETNLNPNEESNLNTSEAKFDEEETQKALKSDWHSPRINYDLQMLSKRQKTNDSGNSDFELTLESGASHEEKEPASSDTDSRKSKVSSATIRKASALKKKKLSLSKKAPSPVDERMRDSDDSVSESKLTLENGSSHENKELASTDTDSKNEAVVNGKLKRTKKKTRTSPRKARLPVAEVKSENELASENGSLHEDEDQASSDTDPKTSTANTKLKKASDLKKEKLDSPEKAPAPLVPSAVAEARHKLNDLEPKSEEDEVSSDDSADEGEDLNESLLHSTEPTYQPTVEEKRILASIEIQIKHKVLPQHKVESTAGTRTLKQREKDEFEKYATLKRGTFDSTEDKQIKKNWKMFCKNHDWNPKNPKPFLFMKIKNKEALMSQVNRKRFMQVLAHGLPNRSLYSVFQRFKNLYDPHRTCRYTEDEDRVIVGFISTYNAVDAKDRKFAELATILKRTRASVWRRYRVLKKKNLLRLDDGLCHSSR